MGRMICKSCKAKPVVCKGRCITCRYRTDKKFRLYMKKYRDRFYKRKIKEDPDYYNKINRKWKANNRDKFKRLQIRSQFKSLPKKMRLQIYKELKEFL